eukprot:TRINITY_DN7158_c0_g2_i5.p1 TRINITY_DN7158_c0_g2~~TRINITY_DN7158_c0_g2_i5.p1  ORF type:complete len:220 (-),score=23.58 TRINITY_DN7158_c0_g2_i5:84-698(-)
MFLALRSPMSRQLFHTNRMYSMDTRRIRSTTIICVRKGNKVVMVGDGQMTEGNAIVAKSTTKKVRKLRSGVLVGMAGNAGDCLALLDILESHLEETGDLLGACVNMVKAIRTGERWRTQLDAHLVVADKIHSFIVQSSGTIIEAEDGLLSLGSGGDYALASAKALIDIDGLDAEYIARKAMNLAADMCIFTNHNHTVESIEIEE